MRVKQRKGLIEPKGPISISKQCQYTHFIGYNLIKITIYILL